METDQSSAPLSKKIFILGSTGRTGKEVIDIALARGHEVTAFGRSPAKITRRHQRLTVVKGDPRSAKELSTALLGHDLVEIDFTCSCPAAALLCKHIAAVLYGSARGSTRSPSCSSRCAEWPSTDFVTRTALRRASPPKEVLAADSLEGIFGIELDRAPRRRGR